MLQKGIIVQQRGGGKANSSASGWTKRGLLHSVNPSEDAEARPAAADRLVPARSPPRLLSLPQLRNRWREERKEEKEGNGSFFSAWQKHYAWVVTVSLLYTKHSLVCGGSCVEAD